jgi:hypothetical protein
VVEGFTASGITGIGRGQGGFEGAKVGSDSFDGIGIGLFITCKQAGHLGAGFSVLRAANEPPERVDVEPGADTFEVGSGFGTDEGRPRIRDGMAGGAVQFGEEDETALAEESVVVLREVKLVEGIDVRMVERWSFQRVCLSHAAEASEQQQAGAGKKSASNGG